MLGRRSPGGSPAWPPVDSFAARRPAPGPGRADPVRSAGGRSPSPAGTPAPICPGPATGTAPGTARVPSDRPRRLAPCRAWRWSPWSARGRLSEPPRPEEGSLVADAFILSRTDGATAAPALSPDGLAALHVAVYAALTRTFDRHDTLVAGGPRAPARRRDAARRLLLWRTARRIGLRVPRRCGRRRPGAACPPCCPRRPSSTSRRSSPSPGCFSPRG